MLIEVKRKIFTATSTIGEMFIDGVFECYTLEDCVREGPKVPGKTAIPAGNYEVVIDMSTRFKRMMPHILNVLNFAGVRIHCGNKDTDTEGCILLGKSKSADFIGMSRAAFDDFFPKLQAAVLHGPATLIITNEAS